MSKPNLPPLPDLPEKEITDVICNDDGDEWPVREWLEEDLRAWATSYAEEAVRQALAELVPVGWVMQVGMRQEFIPKSKVLLATSMGYQPKPLAIIPENSDE